MGKLKDAVTDVTFTLVATGETLVRVGNRRMAPRYATFFTYEGDNGAVLRFRTGDYDRGHCVVEQGNDLGMMLANSLMEKFHEEYNCTIKSDAEIPTKIILDDLT